MNQFFKNISASCVHSLTDITAVQLNLHILGALRWADRRRSCACSPPTNHLFSKPIETETKTKRDLLARFSFLLASASCIDLLRFLFAPPLCWLIMLWMFRVNLVQRVLRLLGQQAVTVRDSGVMEKYVFFVWLFTVTKLRTCGWNSTSSESLPATPLTKKPEDSGN